MNDPGYILFSVIAIIVSGCLLQVFYSMIRYTISFNRLISLLSKKNPEECDEIGKHWGTMYVGHFALSRFLKSDGLEEHPDIKAAKDDCRHYTTKVGRSLLIGAGMILFVTVVGGSMFFILLVR